MFAYDPVLGLFRNTADRLRDLLPASPVITHEGANCILDVTWTEDGLTRTAKVISTECSARRPLLRVLAQASSEGFLVERVVTEMAWKFQPVDMWLFTAVETARGIQLEELEPAT